jgi:uncharacterized membrane protein YqhA
MRLVYLSVFLIIQILLPGVSIAQTVVFAEKMGANSDDYGRSVAVDATGNIYTTGSFIGTVDFDPGAGVFNLTAVGSDDVFVSKLDANGNFVWAKQLGGFSSDVGFSIALDAAGNVYTTGWFANTADFDPGVGTFNLISVVGSIDVFISKLDASGNFIWAQQLAGASGDIAYDITVDAAGNVYTTGSFFGTSDFDPGPGFFSMTSNGGNDIFISKLDASGNFVWAKKMGGSANDVGYSITVDASGNVHTTGSFDGTVDFNPGVGTFNLVSIGSTDIFISKLDALGNYVWAKSMGASNTDEGRNIKVDAAGNIYTTGYFIGTVDFDPGATTYSLASLVASVDIFISKLDAAGNFVWARSMGGNLNDYGFSIALDASGNVYTTGLFRLTADFDPGAGVFNLTSTGVDDIFISKLNSSGNFVWAKRMGGASTDVGNSIVVDASSNVYSTGYFGGTANFDPGPGLFLSSAGLADIFVHKICQAFPQVPGNINGNTTVCSGVTNVYSVNPVQGATGYTWSLPVGWSGTSTTNTISATAGVSGVFTVIASNPCGTSPAQVLSVTVNQTPTISVNSGSTCSGNSFTIVPSGANTYTIQGGNAIVTPTANSSYTVIGTGASGCGSTSFAISSITVNITPTISVSSGSICSGNTFTIVPTGASTYTFEGGSAIVSPTISSSYTVIGTSAAGCVSSLFATSNVTVNALPLPIITVNSGSICSGQSFTIIPTGANTFTFQGGSSIVSPLANASYTVIGTSIAGCISSLPATSNVTVQASPTLTVLITPTLICLGQTATLSASGALTYTWNPIIPLNGIVMPSATTTYSIIGTNSINCASAQVVKTISVSLCTNLFDSNNENDKEVSIYPNPANGYFTINLTSNEEVIISDSYGKIIYKEKHQKQKIEISVMDFSKGIYFTRIGSVMRKLIIE